MKYLFLMLLSACAPTLEQHLTAEQAFHDPEYIADCEYYHDLDCHIDYN